jgi:hypothetical protein
MEAVYKLEVSELNEAFIEQLKKLFAGGFVEIKVSSEAVSYDEIPTSVISRMGMESMREEWLMPENAVWNSYLEADEV